MILTILIIFLTIIGLMVLHELGHFLVAKKFGVKVEEFGVGYPPRIFGKKIGETIYSLNLLPFGAFVKMVGEEERIKDERSFSQKPIWQRALILLGGVVSFWLIAFLILTLVAGIWGLPTAVSDDFNHHVEAAQVQIINVASNSPAEMAGLRAGDIIVGIDKIKEIQQFTQEHLGQEITLGVKRGKDILWLKLFPRVSPPQGEGAMGVALVRVVKLKYPWYKAPLLGAQVTAQKTVEIPMVLGLTLAKLFQGEKVEGMRMVGPIGIGQLMSQALGVGVDNFLMFIAIISIWLALFNTFPIPALDGGKLLFLGIEGVRKRPVSQVIEQKITAVFFFLLIALMIFVTIKDVIRLF